MFVMGRLYINKCVETLLLFSFTCLLNHNDDVSRHLEYLLAHAAILNTSTCNGGGLFGNNVIILRNVTLRHVTPDQVVRSFQLRNVC